MSTQDISFFFFLIWGGGLQTCMRQTTLTLSVPPSGLPLPVLRGGPGVNTAEQPGVLRSVQTKRQSWVQILTPAIICSEMQRKWLDHFATPFIPRTFVKRKKNTWFYWNKFIVDNTNPHPSEMVKVRVSGWYNVCNRGREFYHKKEPVALCGGQYEALTRAHPDSSSHPSTWLPSATFLQPPELRSLDIFHLSLSPDDEGSKNRCGWYHHLEIDKNPHSVREALDTCIQRIMKQSLKRASLPRPGSSVG